MSTEIASAYIALTTKMPGVKKEIEASLGEAESVATESGQKSGNAWAQSLAVGLVAGTAVVAAAVGVLATKVISAFGELEQNLGGSEAVFGEYAESVQKTGEEAYKNLGVSQSDYLATANKMGALFQGSGVEQVRSLEMTTDAMQRAADMASVMGIDMDVAMESVAGAAKGNFTMMDNLGVAMNATSIEAYAAGKGMEDWSFATATSAEKAEMAMGMFMDNTSQYAGNYAKEATETVSGSFGLLSASWEEVIAGLGNKDADMGRLTENLADAIKAVISNVAPIVANMFEALPEVIGGFLVEIGPEVEGFIRGLDIPPLDFLIDSLGWLMDHGDLVAAVLAGIGAALLVSLAPALWGVVAASWAWTAAMLANPMTWIILGIVALVAAIVMLVLNWETVVAWIGEVWDGFVAWIGQVWEGFVNWMGQVWEGFVNWIGEVWSGFMSWIEGVLNGFVSLWNNVWGAVGQFISDVWNNIVNWVKGAMDNVSNFISSALGSIRSAWESVWNGIGGFLKGVWNNILGWIEGGVNGAIDLINGMIGGISDVAAIIGIEIGTIPHVRIPRLAEGGVVSRRPGGILANIGEGRYDEAVVPLSPDVLSKLGGGNGGTVNIYPTFQQADSRLQMRQWGREAERALAAI